MTTAEFVAILQALPVEQQGLPLIHASGYGYTLTVWGFRLDQPDEFSVPSCVLLTSYASFLTGLLTPLPARTLAARLAALPPEKQAQPVYVARPLSASELTGVRPITQDLDGRVVYLGLITDVQPAAPRGSLKTKFDDP